MSGINPCERCGSRLPADAEEGLCPRCLLAFGIEGFPDEVAEAAASEEKLCDFGDYELLEEIGRGGMGVVYRARQKSLNRIVAVKLILTGTWATDLQVQRFRAEAETAARLDHPNIVPIYEIGEHNGQPFFSMKYVDGRNLAGPPEPNPEGSSASSPAPSGAPSPGPWIDPASAAAILVQVARAVHYAHQHRVLHRDLKPTNILLDSNGRPHLTDFGLAKVLETSTSFTHSMAVVGTPSYMSPEQARGRAREITTAADVYSLGAILYELLTGRPPFSAETPLEVLDRVREDNPPPPSAVCPGVNRDLETICLKCLRKEPSGRYGSAEALAEDLERWLAGKPILARPVAPLERLWLWSRRKPTIAALAAAVVFLVLTTAIGSTWLAIRIAAARDEARRQAESNRRQLVRSNVENGLRLLEAGEDLSALTWLGEALRLEDGVAARETPHRMRIHAVLRDCPQLAQLWFHDQFVTAAVFSPDGASVATCGFDGTARVWDVGTGEPRTPVLWQTNRMVDDDRVYIGTRARHADWNPRGDRLVVVCNYEARIWEIPSGKPVGSPIVSENEIWSAHFSPDGRYIVTASSDRTARIWDAETGAPVGKPMRHESAVEWAVFSPDGRWIATASRDHTARLWNAATQEPKGEALTHLHIVRRVAFSPDGSRLVTGSHDGTARVWDVATGKQVGAPIRHRAEIRTAVFSADGRRIATASSDRTARVWDAATGEPIGPPLVHNALVDIVRFSPDGRRVVTGSFDNTARIWDPETGETLGPPLSHNHVVSQAAFHPDGRRVLTASHDGVARLWVLPPEEILQESAAPMADLDPVAFSADGAFALCTDSRGTAQIWHLPSGRCITPPMTDSVRLRYAVFGPHGLRILTILDDLTHQLWNLPGGKPLALPWQTDVCQVPPVFNPEGTRLLTAVDSCALRVFEAPGGRPRSPRLVQHDGILALAWSPDGGLFASGSVEGQVRVWDANTFEPAAAIQTGGTEILHLSFSPDGRLLAAAGRDGTVRVWDARTGLAQSPPLLHPRSASFSLFSPDGRRLLTVADDRKGRLWDWQTGRLTALPMSHDYFLKHAAFHPSGARVITIDEWLTIRLWDTATGQPIYLPDRDPNLRPAEAGASELWPWDPPADSRPTADLVALTQLLSGRRIDGAGGLIPLDREKLKVLWRAVRGR